MAVMAMRRAVIAPTVPPTSTPARIIPMVAPSSDPWPQIVRMVTATAMAMPVMPSMLPRRLVTGLDRPRNARMNRTPETR